MFKVNEPRIAHETLNNETIIIDFSSGIYFSLSSEANFIWQCIVHDLSIDDIVDSISKASTVDQSFSSKCVELFINQLLGYELIVQSDNEVFNQKSSNSMPSSLLYLLEAMKVQKFCEPVLNIHNDLQDLLLTDPVHDVTSKGWPNKK